MRPISFLIRAKNMTEYHCAVSKRRVRRGVEPKIRTNLFPPRISLRQNCYGQASNAGKTKSPSGQPPTRTIRLSHYLKEIDRSRRDNPGSPGWETEVLDKVAAKTDLLDAAELLQAIQFLKDTGAYSRRCYSAWAARRKAIITVIYGFASD